MNNSLNCFFRYLDYYVILVYWLVVRHDLPLFILEYMGGDDMNGMNEFKHHVLTFSWFTKTIVLSSYDNRMPTVFLGNAESSDSDFM